MTSKEQYIRNQEIIMRRLAKAFVPKVYAAIMSQIAEAVKAVREKGVLAAQGNINGSIINTVIGPTVKDLYQTAARLALSKYRPNKKAFGDNEDFITSVLEYFQKYLLDKVVLPITQTTIDHVEKVLQEALDNGWGVDKTIKLLEDTELPKWRARLIVRTESARATNFTQMAAADEEDVEMEKQWIAIDDNRTRKSHSHRGVDGQRVDLDQAFSNGLMFPGDPNGPAKEVCNCRCTLGYFAKRDENGNVIPKKPAPLNLISRMNIAKLAA